MVPKSFIFITNPSDDSRQKLRRRRALCPTLLFGTYANGSTFCPFHNPRMQGYCFVFLFLHCSVPKGCVPQRRSTRWSATSVFRRLVAAPARSQTYVSCRRHPHGRLPACVQGTDRYVAPPLQVRRRARLPSTVVLGRRSHERSTNRRTPCTRRRSSLTRELAVGVRRTACPFLIGRGSTRTVP